MRLFVDMDGTLAVFTPVDTLETLYEKGYFAKLEPHIEVLEGLKLFIKENPEIEVNILSSVLDDSKYALEEKQEWLDRYLPEIDREHRFFPACGTEKTSAISGGVRLTDILLDDYTKNLQDWEPPAIGIKLMNGINGTKGTWTGCRVYYDLSPRSFSLTLRANIGFAISKLNLEGSSEMNLRKIQNGSQSFTVLDEINQGSEKQRLLLIRDTDSSVIIAHGWNERTGEWDHGTYYNSELSSLSTAISDFEQYRMEQTILDNHEVLKKEEVEIYNPEWYKNEICAYERYAEIPVEERITVLQEDGNVMIFPDANRELVKERSQKALSAMGFLSWEEAGVWAMDTLSTSWEPRDFYSVEEMEARMHEEAAGNPYFLHEDDHSKHQETALTLVREYFDEFCNYEDEETVYLQKPSEEYMENIAKQLDLSKFPDYQNGLTDEIAEEISRINASYDEELDKPVAIIAPGINRLNFIVELDEQSQQNIENAIRIVEMREGYSGSELEAVVSEAMTNRLCDLEEDITLISGNMLGVDGKAVKEYLKLQAEREKAADYASALKKSMLHFDENSRDYQALLDEMNSFIAPNLSALEKKLAEMRKEYPVLETLNKLSSEIFEELNYEEQFKALLSVEFPDIAGDEILQGKLYQSFLDSPYSSFFGDDLYDYLDHQIGKLQEESLNHVKENGKSIYLVKDDGKELE